MSMRHRFCAVLVVTFGLAEAAPALAHHSVSGVFDVHKQVVLKGVISKVEWFNPHTYIHLDVKDNDGKITPWQIETLPPNWWRTAGIAKETIFSGATAGEVVTLNVYEAHDSAKHLGYLLRITYSDGHFIHVTGDPKDIVPSN
jgi:hypothetical protein